MKILAYSFVSRRGYGKLNYNAWPSIVTLDDGELLCAWSGERHEHICPFGKVSAARSVDGGKNWEPPYVVMDTPLDDRDAGLCLSDGRIYLTSFNNSRAQQRHYAEYYEFEKERRTLYEGYLNLVTDEEEKRYLGSVICYSDDGGKTFSEPRVMPVTAPHGPIAMKNGKLLYIGRSFRDAAEASFDYLPGGIYAMELDRDLNATKPWKIVDEAEEKDVLYCEPHACVLPDGKILLAIRKQNDHGLFTVDICSSTDGGKTFSKPMPTGFEGSPPHLLVHSSGKIVMTYARRKAPFSIIARVSDDGNAWSDEFILDDTAPDWDLGYPCTAENARGELVTVFYHKDKNETSKFVNDVRAVVWTL